MRASWRHLLIYVYSLALCFPIGFLWTLVVRNILWKSVPFYMLTGKIWCILSLSEHIKDSRNSAVENWIWTLITSAFSKLCNENTFSPHLLIVIHILGDTTVGVYLTTCSYTIQSFNSCIKGIAHILLHLSRLCFSVTPLELSQSCSSWSQNKLWNVKARGLFSSIWTYAILYNTILLS